MRRLVLDIEVSPMIAVIWGLRNNQYINPDNVVQDSYILTWAAKWVGQKKVYSDTRLKSGNRKMLANMAELLEQANVVIGYNSSRFDMPILQQEMFMLGLPVVEYKQIDLLKVVRQNFRFASNKLDYISKKLDIRKGKLETGGLPLWMDCMDHNNDAKSKRKAYRVMRKYNEEDVVLTEELYLKLLPYINNHPNWNVYTDDKRLKCPTCGSPHVTKKGMRYTKTGTYQRWLCTECHSHCQSNVQNKRQQKEILK